MAVISEPEHEAELEPDIEDFMEMMDRELSKTHIAKSFERNQTAPKAKTVGVSYPSIHPLPLLQIHSLSMFVLPDYPSMRMAYS